MPGRERHVRRASQSDRRVVARQSLDDEHLRERVGAPTAEFLRKRHAEKTQLPELLDDMARERFFLIPLGRMRLDFPLGKIGQRLADAPLLFGKIEIHDGCLTWRDVFAHPLDDIFS